MIKVDSYKIRTIKRPSYATILLLSVALVGCGGTADNASKVTPELQATNKITELFYAVTFAKKQGQHCATIAKNVDIKHMQTAISLSNAADNSKRKQEDKDKLYNQSTKQALDGLAYFKKERCGTA